MSTAALKSAGMATIGDRERLLAFSFANADLLIETDENLVVRYVSGALRSLTGLSEPEAIGRSLVSLFAARDQLLIKKLLQGLVNNTRLEPLTVALHGNDDRPRPALLAGYRMDDHVRHYFLTISKARLSANEQAAANRADAETGLLSSDDFAALVADRSAAADGVDATVQLTMIQLDQLDQFKGKIGADNAGRLMGEMGALLRSVSVGGNTAGRLSDERFGVLHDAAIDGQSVRRRVEALGREADPTRQGVAVAESTLEVGGSDLSPEDSAKVLVYAIRKFADAGDKDFTIHSLADGMQEMLNEAVAKVSSFKHTVANRNIDVALQPIVDLGELAIHHYEALCRPRNGQSPATFVGFAEQVGLVGDFDLMVCQKVIDLLVEAARNGQRPDIALNLSAVSLESDIFVAAFRRLLEPYPALRPKMLIEVTESTQIKDLDAAEKVLQQLRRDGHMICLDDFGAGAAAFQYIQALTVDFVKIDGAYVKRMMGEGRDTAILKAMAGLCRELDVGTIAEMIETEPQAARLKELGVGFGQGYLFGRPRLDYMLPVKPPPVFAHQTPNDQPSVTTRRRSAP